MAISGYRDFGNSVNDVVQDVSGNALGNISLSVWTEAEGGVQVTDVLDADGNPTGGMVVSQLAPNLGRIYFQAPESYNVLYLDDGEGDRWLIVATDLYQALASFDTSTIAETLSLLVEKNNNFSTQLLSMQEEVATTTQLALDAMDLASDAMGNMVPTSQSFLWRWENATLANGVALEPIDLVSGNAFKINNSPIFRMDNPSSSQVVVTLEMISPSNTVTELYAPGTRPIIPAGSTKYIASIPETNIIPDQWSLRPKLITAPNLGGGPGTVATFGNSSSYSSNGSTAHSPDLPTGAVAGDIIIMVAAYSGTTTATVDSGWQLKMFQRSDATTPRAAISVWMAQWSAALTSNITLSTSGPLLASCIILKDSTLINPFVNSSNTGLNADQLDHTIPGFTSSEIADLTLYGAAIWYPANLDNYRISSTGGKGITEIVDNTTTRSGTTNFGLWLAKGSNLIAGEVLAPVSLTSAPGTGGGNPYSTSWASFACSIKRGSSTTPPSYLRAQVDLTEVQD